MHVHYFGLMTKKKKICFLKAFIVIITTGHIYAERDLDMPQDSCSMCTCMFKIHCKSQQIVGFRAEVRMF